MKDGQFPIFSKYLHVHKYRILNWIWYAIVGIVDITSLQLWVPLHQLFLKEQINNLV